MKKYFLSIAVILLAATSFYGQSKKELKYQIYQLQKQVSENDALKDENQKLKDEKATIQAELEKYKTENQRFRADLKQFSNSNQEQQDSQKTSTEYQAPRSQCKAITAAGTQCKRMADPGSDYCWQHKKSSQSNSSGSYSGSRTIQTGPRGGQYYINKNGKKTYIKKK